MRGVVGAVVCLCSASSNLPRVTKIHLEGTLHPLTQPTPACAPPPPGPLHAHTHAHSPTYRKSASVRSEGAHLAL